MASSSRSKCCVRYKRTKLSFLGESIDVSLGRWFEFSNQGLRKQGCPGCHGTPTFWGFTFWISKEYFTPKLMTPLVLKTLWRPCKPSFNVDKGSLFLANFVLISDGTIGIESSDCILTSLQKTLRIFWGTLPNCHLLKNFYSTSELAFQSAFSFVQTSVILIRVNHFPP